MEKGEKVDKKAYHLNMGRGADDNLNAVGLKRNPFRQEILDINEAQPGSLAKEKAEIELLGSPFSYADDRWGEALLDILRFSDGRISPEEILLAQEHGFRSKILDGEKVLYWTTQGEVMLGKDQDSSTYLTPSRYEKMNIPGVQPWINKEWYSENRLSRPLHLGPAVVPLTQEDGAANPRARYEWWYKGKIVGTYSQAGGYLGAPGEQIEKGDPPDENTPWPGNNEVANALSRCQNKAEETVVDHIFSLVTNPFAIYPGRYVEEEGILETIPRATGLKKSEAREAIASLVERGVLRRKAQGIPMVSRARVLGISDEAATTFQASQVPFEEEHDPKESGSSPERLARLKKLWQNPEEINELVEQFLQEKSY